MAPMGLGSPESGNRHLMSRLLQELSNYPTSSLALLLQAFFHRASRMIFLKSDIKSCPSPAQNLPVASTYTQDKIPPPFHGLQILSSIFPPTSQPENIISRYWQGLLTGVCSDWWVPLSGQPLNILNIYPDHLFCLCPLGSSHTGFAVPGTYQEYFHLHQFPRAAFTNYHKMGGLK